MTLRDLADALARSPEPTPSTVAELTRLAIQLRRAGVAPTAESCADRASLAAWIASADWLERPDRLAAELVIEHDQGEALYMEAARLLAAEVQ